MKAVVFQTRLQNAWHDAALFEVVDESLGIASRSYLQYDTDYVLAHLNAHGHAALSARFPVNFELHSLGSWPAFALDLLPGGNARRVLSERLGVMAGPTADFALLAQAQFAPGNIRVKPSVELPLPVHEGFREADILARKDTFIEYAHAHGASVAGSSGAQGDAPKFLLAQDRSGRWHSEGALSDQSARTHWLVKFPRGRSERDRLILRNEAAYMRVAKRCGLRVAALPEWKEDTLFVPRFDRREGEFFGLESLCSLAGVAQFGAAISQDELCKALLAHSSTPQEDVREMILRDALNVALGNTDNHARNSAVLKTPDGRVALSPLYDFAPMALDPEGIARVCRWDEAENDGFPKWSKVASRYGVTLPKLPLSADMLRECGVDDEVIDFVSERMRRVLKDLP